MVNSWKWIARERGVLLLKLRVATIQKRTAIVGQLSQLLLCSLEALQPSHVLLHSLDISQQRRWESADRVHSGSHYQPGHTQRRVHDLNVAQQLGRVRFVLFDVPEHVVSRR